MSQFGSDNDSKPVRIVIDGKEVDPKNLSPNKIKVKASQKSGCVTILTGLGALAVLFSIVFGVLAAASDIFGFNIPFMDSLMWAMTGVEAPQTQSIKTDANHFDPFIGMEQARELAGSDALLISIRSSYVRSDGTMDLHADYDPDVSYEFVREIPRPEDAPPVGVGGSTNGQWYEPISIDAYRPGTRRYVSVVSGGTKVSYSYTNEGMLREADSPTTSLSGELIPDPQCTTKQLWDVALRKDAPRDAVAVINYDASGYSFIISGVLNLYFEPDCTLKE